MSWIENKTIAYDIDDLPFDNEGTLKIEDISKVALKMDGSTYPIDIGSFCYAERDKPYRNTTNSSCATVLVNPKSFRKERIAFLKSYISFLSDTLKTGKSKITLKSYLDLFSRFVNWCDKFEVEALDGKSQFVLAYENFSYYLHEKVKSSRLNINSASSMQLAILTTGKGIYGDPYGDLFSGYKRIKKSLMANNATTPPDEKSVAFSLSTYKQIFEELSEFTIKRKKFPYSFKLHENFFWIFPLPQPFVNSHPNKRNKSQNKFNIVYDFDNGRLRNYQQILELSSSCDLNYSDWKIKYSIRRAEIVLEKSNTVKTHRTRRFIASLAMQAFIMMFSSATGMNLKQIATLPWSDTHFDMSNEIQGFKSIKARSGNKMTTFHLSQDFVKYFRSYLNLRREILDIYGVKEFEFLFFSTAVGISNLRSDFSSDFNNRLRRNFDIDIKINIRMWRAYKSDWLVRNKDITTTAMILQNSPQTVVKHYSEGSESAADIEMTKFFSVYKQNIIISKRVKSKSIALGQCTDIQNPEKLQESAIPTNCITPEGCLYCKNYRVHADEPDLRKLFSCQYVLNSSRTLLDSNAQFEEIYLPVIKKIDLAIEKIESTARIDRKDIEKIRISVFNHEQLDPYWMGKLKMLENLGVI